jgi:hypothetical protein
MKSLRRWKFGRLGRWEDNIKMFEKSILSMGGGWNWLREPDLR